MEAIMIVVYGSFNADYVWRTSRLPMPGQTCLGEFSSAPGGKGFNQAVAAHLCGGSTMFVGTLGRDAAARMARSVAAELQLPCRLLESDQATGTACVVVDDEGRNQIVVAPGANWVAGDPDLEVAAAEFAAARIVLVQLECAADSVQGALRRGRASGALNILNPAPAPAGSISTLLALSDVLTPNETEFSSLLPAGSAAQQDWLQLEDAVLHQLCRELQVPTVLITLGAAGAFVSHGADWRGDPLPYYRVPTPSVAAIDTTGAGDCFNGALAASLQRHPQAAFASHVRFACRAAALSTEREGAALAMPTLQQLLERFPE